MQTQFWKKAAMAAFSFGFLAVSTNTALAGECPADQVKTDATKPGATANKGATDKILGMIDLSKEPAAINDRKFRMRQIEIMPGGEIAWHSHGDRPALIYIVSGSVTEYASNCAVPIVHKRGDVSVESHAVSHWWKNTGKRKAVLISADLPKDPADAAM